MKNFYKGCYFYIILFVDKHQYTLMITTFVAFIRYFIQLYFLSIKKLIIFLLQFNHFTKVILCFGLKNLYKKLNIITLKKRK